MVDRRTLLKAIAATGIGSAMFHRAVAAMQRTADEELTIDSIKQAEWITDVELTDEEREEILDSVRANNRQHQKLREFALDASVGPAVHFRPLSAIDDIPAVQRSIQVAEPSVVQLPTADEDIAFLTASQLSGVIRTRQLSSMRLTEIYLRRLKRYGPMLRCVVNLTEDLARKQAARADQEIAAGNYRGPLHGIPWGAKDLISVPGYPTTWGIPYLKDQLLPTTATVAKRLDEAGAVLVAKLSLGALAMGDRWFGGLTRNPWNPRDGASGSSAGSASAVVAGLVGFTLGSETLGSITSPSKRCGATGFRPTFGRVSRHGCMPLSWSMDKIGPICRSVEDCALVFAAIHGNDGKDLTVRNYAFDWPANVDLSETRVGYEKSEKNLADRRDLAPLLELGCQLVELKLPTDIPTRPLANIIDVEAASVFDALLRAGHTEGWNSWTNTFRSAQYISAVDYLRYQRVRTKLAYRFEEFMSQVDLIANMDDVFYTNLTGHPSIVIPYEYEVENDVRRPVTMKLTGHLNNDDQLLTVAHSYQGTIEPQQLRPRLDEWLQKFDDGTLDS